MAFVLELFEGRQLDFSIDIELLYDLMDNMIANDEIKVDVEIHDNIKDLYININDLPKILEKLEFTIIPKIQHGKHILTLFAPPPIRMQAVKIKENQPFVRSSSSGL